METSIEEPDEHFDDFQPADGQEQQSSEISKVLQRELTETEEFKKEFDEGLHCLMILKRLLPNRLSTISSAQVMPMR